MEKKNKLHSVSQGEEQILSEKMLDDLGIGKEQSEDLKESTRKALASLTPREERILRDKYGIGTDYAFDSSGHVYTTLKSERKTELSTERYKTKRKDNAYTPEVPKMTSAWQSQFNFEENKTPSVMTKMKADKNLLALQSLHDKGVYTFEDWQELVQVLSSYFADVCEGAGLQYSHHTNYLNLQRAVSDILKYRFKVVEVTKDEIFPYPITVKTEKQK